jgi:glycosyltransferase involved in cell wall biosynthesis
MNKVLHRPSNYVMETIYLVLKQYLTNWQYFKWSECFRNYLLSMHVATRLFCETLKNLKPKLLLIDDPIFLAPAVQFASTQGVPLVAFCHNIETLSPCQVTGGSQRDLLRYELDLLARCDLVVTISREETFLLKNLGMVPHYFPYFPLPETATRMEKIRLNRGGSEKQHFLLLGTALNLPTLEGMRTVITRVREDRNLLGGDRLLVAGYGSAQLQNVAIGERVVLRGEVSDVELDALLTDVKACIIYQENGSGALTRIPELLAAGVPIVVNSHAARSYHNVPGIIEFASLDQLPEKLSVAASTQQFPFILTPPDGTALCSKLQRLY